MKRISVLVFLFMLSLAAMAAAPDAAAAKGQPLSGFLKSDGSLDLPEDGIRGSIDPTGYRLVNAPGKPPRFAPLESANGPGPLAAGDENWDGRFSLGGVYGKVYALVWDGANLYAGGEFTSAGGVSANYIAKWDGGAWSALGSGMNNAVRALVWDGSNLYAGGWFTAAGGTPANYIAKWDGGAWSALGSGMNSYVNALAWDGSSLYAGGEFTSAGGVPASNIAKWNGNAWSALGSGMNDDVYALAWDGVNLYAGGVFTEAGGVSANRIAKWDGTAWSALGSGLDGRVFALAWDGANLYAGGGFNTAGGVSANYIAKWGGSSWSAIGSGLDGIAYALAWDGANLFAGGDFTWASGASANCIAKWDGSAWSALGSGMYTDVRALAWDGANLFAGGEFTEAGGAPANNIAKWDGGAWSALESAMEGMNGNVSALAWDGANLYAGGGFTIAGGISANSIAKWDGNAWSALGSGMIGHVYAIASDEANLYAGGFFTTAGGVSANNIAKWDGTAWSALGSGISGSVLALAWDGANLYAGGFFTTAGGASANRIAKWDGGAWSALGSGMSGGISALAWDGANLYAGGGFTMAGGVSANCMAKWDGNAWSALGAGMNGGVSALAWDGANLYSGGYFTEAGGASANRIAMWDGSAWRALGTGMNANVRALAWDGANLYAGGYFAEAGGVPASNIAKWNGNAWSALGSGINNDVNALVWDGSSLYAGGEFTTAGGKGSSFIGRWCPPPEAPANFTVIPGCAGNSVSWDPTSGATSYNVLRGATCGTVVTTFAGVTSPYNDTTAVAGTAYQYWVVALNTCGASPNSPCASATRPGTISSPTISGASSGCASTGVALSTQAFATYQWSIDGSDIAGATAQSCTVTQGGPYTVTVTDGSYCQGTAPPHLVSIFPPPAIEGPADQCKGTPAILRTGAYASYQWRRNGLDIPGALNSIYSVLSSGVYSVRTADANGCSETSPNHSLTYHDLPAPTVSGPSSGCLDPPLVLSTQLFSAYQWNKDGVEISGATNQSLAVTESGNYSARVVDPYGCTSTSTGKSVTVYLSPAPVISGNASGCAAPGVELSTGPFSTYQWKLDGAAISGATTSSYTGTQSGSYTVIVSNSNGCYATSPAFTLTVSQNPTIWGGSEACEGASLTISTGAFASYQWRLDGADIAWATTSSYTSTQSGIYSVRVTSTDGCEGISAGHQLTFHPPPAPTVIGPSKNPCGQPWAVLATQEYAACQWYYEGILLEGVTGSICAAMVSGTYSVAASDSYGCVGMSPGFHVTVEDCVGEISPEGSEAPARLTASNSSSTGFYLFFQKLDYAEGYSYYEGSLAAAQSGAYDHGAGAHCDIASTDMGNGEMRSEIAPSPGDHYYLVTARANGIEGPSGFWSNGQEIDPTKSTCEP